MRARLAWALLTALGCGGSGSAVVPDVTATEPEYNARCGVEGPVLLLDLEANEHPFRVDPVPGEDRVLVGLFEAAGSLGLFPDRTREAIVSVGPCGESPTLVAEDMALVGAYEEVQLACASDGDALYRVDPTGESEPVLLLAGTCAVRRTDAGLVAVLSGGGGVGRLVIMREPGAAAVVVETLLDNVVVPTNVFFGGGDYRSTPLWASGGEAITLTPDGLVLAVDLQDSAVSVLAEGAASFLAAADGRRIVWQVDDVEQHDEEAPAGVIVLHDRDAGTDLPLLKSHLPWTTSPFRHGWVVLRDNSVLGQRLFDGDTGESLGLPEGTALRAVLGDAQFWLARDTDGRTEELLWEPPSEPRLIIDHAEGFAEKSGDGFKVFAYNAADGLEGTLSYGSFDGGVERWSDRVNFHHRVLADGRILGIVDEDSNQHGALRLEDPGTGALVMVDPHGYLHSPSLNANDLFAGDVVYSVDGDGESRHGLYRASIR